VKPFPSGKQPKKMKKTKSLKSPKKHSKNPKMTTKTTKHETKVYAGGRELLSEVGQLIGHLLHLVGVDNSSFGFRFVRTNSRLKESWNIFQTVWFPTFLLEVVSVLVYVGGFHFKELGQTLAFGGVLKTG